MSCGTTVNTSDGIETVGLVPVVGGGVPALRGSGEADLGEGVEPQVIGVCSRPYHVYLALASEDEGGR